MTELFSSRRPGEGMLVTIDGPNGSGKTTLLEAVALELAAADIAVWSTRQPSPSEMGAFVRKAERSVRGRALACLVAADRHHQVDTEILPALDRGELVLCDRYIESSLVLQRIDGVDVEFVLAVNAGIPRPDLRIRLSASEDVLRDRLAGRARDPARRFEQSPDGPARELELYGAADQLLGSRYGLEAVIRDTSATEAGGLGREMAELILRRRA